MMLFQDVYTERYHSGGAKFKQVPWSVGDESQTAGIEKRIGKEEVEM